MTKATREDIKTKLPINIRTGMEGGKQGNQLRHRTNQLLGLKWTQWLITRKQASDFLMPSSGPSQQLCPDSLLIKSLPQDSSVFTSWALSLTNSRVTAQTRQLCEASTFQSENFTGQHAIGSKAGVVKSMQFTKTTSCLSTVHVCPPVCLTVSL